ncbi:hypothetical protein [Vibrio sp. D431a]|uniref:hypothetical protein n=1 Tax=Vibrio sp. D431a TaxID=2837388 RepID=UPI002555E20C|nr:hypothetical protein [Vibrio sp. D431a]MDK9789965.1 hypothetical protein [Vibrio sp. D431a]
MTNSVYISLYKEDASAITSHKMPEIESISSLFASCYDLIDDDNADSIGVDLAVNEDVIEWIKGIILDELDSCGVFSQILEKCKDMKKTTFEHLLDKCQTPISIKVH